MNKIQDRQLTKEEAINLYKSEVWKDWSDKEKTEFGLFQNRLAMPFEVMHKAMENIFERPIYTHEFAYKESLIKEYLGEKDPPNLSEIIDLIPEEKRMIILTPQS